MAAYTKVNLKRDVDDSAEQHGLGPELEARFASLPLALEESALSYQRFAPNHRLPFGAPHVGPPPGDVTGMHPEWWKD